MNMKIQNIYPLLQVALLLLLATSCTQDEFPVAQDKARQFTISVTDGGYTLAVDGSTTRAVENGYTTEFTEGDACGLFMTRGLYEDKKMIYSNVKLTAERDASTGKLTWKPEAGTTLAGGLSDEECYLYYPYRADLDNIVDISKLLNTIQVDPQYPFFYALKSNWPVKYDQSSYADYAASDLMTASCTPTLENGKLRLDFVMAHEFPLVVIEMPKTVYKFTDARIPDYTVPSATTFTGSAKPLRMADGTYRYLLPPSLPTIEGSYDEGNREFTITTSASHHVVGEYKRYKVDGAVETIRNYILQVGDFFLADGNLMPKYAEAPEVRAANVVGIVFQTDPSRIGQAEKDKLGGNVHGLVMSVRKTGADLRWGPIFRDEGLTSCETKAQNYSDISGYGNCEHIRSKYGNFDDFPMFKAADDYNTTCPIPTTTTGWYLPSSGQFWDILQNLGGCTVLVDASQQTSSELEDFTWINQGNVPAALNKWMENIADGDKDTFSSSVSKFWVTSSEYFDKGARYWAVDNAGRVDCHWQGKGYPRYNVRPVLAF